MVVGCNEYDKPFERFGQIECLLRLLQVMNEPIHREPGGGETYLRMPVFDDDIVAAVIWTLAAEAEADRHPGNPLQVQRHPRNGRPGIGCFMNR